MCKAVEDYAKERYRIGWLEGYIVGFIAGYMESRIKSVNNLLQNGFKLEEALRLIGLTEQEYKSYKPS